MRRLFMVLLLTMGLAGPSALMAQQARTAAYIVVDQQSGQIFASGAPDAKRQVASLTKVATAMVVLDWAEAANQDLNQLATVSPAVMQVQGQNPLGLMPGDQITLRDLLYIALMQSDNQAAQVLAEHVGARLPRNSGDTPEIAFVVQMNALARSIEMNRTKFMNVHGLDHQQQPTSTAADIARLTAFAIRDKGFLFYVSQPTREVTIQRQGQALRYMLRNTNELLGHEGIDGVKTGMTAKAGGCLILSSYLPPETVQQQGGQNVVTPRRIIVVVLGSTDRFGVGFGLVKQGWQQYQTWAAQGRPQKKGSSIF